MSKTSEPNFSRPSQPDPDPAWTFHAALRRGQSPRVEDFVEEAQHKGFGVANQLLIDLLTCELTYRWSRGDEVDLDTYLNRFPLQNKAVIAAVKAARSNLWIPTSSKHHGVVPLDEGGFGRVYKAVDNLGRTVALKTPASDYGENPLWMRRFLDEAKRACDLDHPGIIKVHEFHEPTDEHPVPFVSMQLAPAGSLAAKLAELEAGQYLTFEDVARITAQVAAALAHAHAKGVIHRDLKPANIAIDEHGSPKLIDFGISFRAEPGTDARPGGTTPERQSETGDDVQSVYGFGTYPYAAPEQWQGTPPQSRSDIWALGVVLYELLTKRLPFEGCKEEARTAILGAKAPPSPRSIRRDVPAALDRICRRCLAADLTARYASAAAVHADLNRWLTRKRRWAIRTALLVSVVVAIAAVLGTWKWQEQRKQRAADAAFVASATEEGRQAVLAGDLDRARELLLPAHARCLESGEPVSASLRFLLGRCESPETGSVRVFGSTTEPLTMAIVSKSGGRIAGWLPGKQLCVWDVETGTRLMSAAVSDESPAISEFSADARQLLTISGSRATVWDVEKGVRAYTCDGHEMDIKTARFSNEGSRVVTASVDNTARVWSDSGRTVLILAGHARSVVSARFNHDATLVVTASFDRTIGVWDAKTGELKKRLRGSRVAVDDAVFSPSGDMVAAGQLLANTLAQLWDVETGQLKREVRSIGQPITMMPRFTPDGRYCLFGYLSRSMDRAVLADLITGNTVSEFAGHKTMISSMDVSPDGTRVLTGGFDKTVRFWDAMTGEELRRLPDPTAAHACHAWFAADGSKMLIAGAEGIWRIRNSDDGPLLQTLPGLALAACSDRYMIRPASTELIVLDKDARMIASYPSRPQLVALCPSSGDVAMATRDGTEIEIVKQANAQVIKLDGLTDGIDSMLWGPSGHELLVAPKWEHQQKSAFRVVGLKSGTIREGWRTDESCIAMAYREGRAVAAMSPMAAGQSFRIVDAMSGETIVAIPYTGMDVSGQFSPNADRLAVADADGGASIFDASTGALLARVQGHKDSFVNTVCFSPDGQLIATGGNDQTVRVWDVESGKCLSVFAGHTAGVVSLFWPPPGDRLISGMSDGQSRVWHVPRIAADAVPTR